MTDVLDQHLVLDVRGEVGGVEVTAVEHDSRRVVPGALFFCLPGQVHDGHRYASDAVRRGAVGVVGERPVDLEHAGVPQFIVAPGTARQAMAHAAAAFHHFPAEALLTAGVTGTNGKTTVSHLLGHVFQSSGYPTSVVGTLSGARTTPEAPDLQAALARVRDDAARAGGRRGAVAMEVSSHALAQHRVDGIVFEVAVFTNLSHEHLDYHRTMDAYFEAKAELFTEQHARIGVVFADDPWGRRLIEHAGVPTVAVHERQVGDVAVGASGSTFSWRGRRVNLRLVGRLNVVNALLAAEAAVAVGLDAPAVAEALSSAPPVPGRMELVAAPGPSGPGFAVLVDYAHTTFALQRALEEARRLTSTGGRVLVGFGCGGERDREKRPQMGEAAATRAEVVIVTDDNPRGEDPEAITADILAGVPPEARAVVETIHDREQAIAALLERATPGDVVLVAGKGHETTQQARGVARPFDDREVVRRLLAAAREG